MIHAAQCRHQARGQSHHPGLDQLGGVSPIAYGLCHQAIGCCCSCMFAMLLLKRLRHRISWAHLELLEEVGGISKLMQPFAHVNGTVRGGKLHTPVHVARTIISI